jgi:hypothetical protein
MLFKGCGVVIYLCKQPMRQGTSLIIQEITDDLRHRLRTVWRDAEGLNPQDTISKLATFRSTSFCSAFLHNVFAQTFAFGSVSTS